MSTYITQTIWGTDQLDEIVFEGALNKAFDWIDQNVEARLDEWTIETDDMSIPLREVWTTDLGQWTLHLEQERA